MPKLLIMGASRGIGLETVKRALDAGHEVRAFARSAPSIAIDDANLEKFRGDALSKANVYASLEGVDAVIQSLGVASPRELIFGTTLFSEATKLLVAGMKDVGVKRLIAVTGAGAGDSRGRINPLYDYVLFPVLLQRVYSDKDIAEDLIIKSGLDWTIVRPGGLTNRPLTGRWIALTDKKDWRGGFISRADVADFLVKQVGDATYIGKTPLLVS
ncbi:MAG: NAD(P)-dependent oxidoreductase [Hyphomicrobium sp.]